jgi:hypothetical protein
MWPDEPRVWSASLLPVKAGSADDRLTTQFTMVLERRTHGRHPARPPQDDQESPVLSAEMCAV